jgi:predicted MFS family arabinose efflux permease
MTIAREDDWTYDGWRIVAASAAGVFVSFASLFIYTFGVFLKPVATEFSWSREAVSAAFGIAAMTVAVVSPAIGYLLDHYPPRRVIVPCLMVFGFAFASLGWLTPSLWHLYAVFGVMGLVGNGTAQMAYSRAVSSWFDRRRGFALAVMMCGGAVGAMVWPPIAQALIDLAGWRTAFVTLGGLVLIVGLPVALLVVRERADATRGARESTAGASFAEGLSSRVFWILVVVLFCSSIAQNGAIAHLSALLTDRGVSASGGALAIASMGAASLAGRLVAGVLLDRFTASRVAFGLLTTAAAGILVLSTAASLPAGVLGAALIGFGMGGEGDVTPYLLVRHFGLRAFARLYSLTWTAYACAGAIGPVLMGRVFDVTGTYEVLLAGLASVTFGTAVLMLALPRPGERVAHAVRMEADRAQQRSV